MPTESKEGSHQLGAISQANFPINHVELELNGSERFRKLPCYFLITKTARNRQRNLPLAWAEQLQKGCRFWAEIRVHTGNPPVHCKGNPKSWPPPWAFDRLSWVDLGKEFRNIWVC